MSTNPNRNESLKLLNIKYTEPHLLPASTVILLTVIHHLLITFTGLKDIQFSKSIVIIVIGCSFVNAIVSGTSYPTFNLKRSLIK